MIGFGTSRRLAAIALLLALAVASSCSEKITSADEQRIDLEIWTSLAGSGEAAQASRFVLTVTGPGIMEPIVAELAPAGGLLTGSVVVPAGPDRIFRIDAYDAAGTLLYSGQTTADVLGGSELRLDIELVPRVPMIKLSPVYLETIQGDLLAMKVSVYNIPDAGALHVLLASYRSVGESYLDTGPGNVIIDPQLAKVAASEIYLDGDYAMHIEMTLRDTMNSMVDGSGYTDVATVYYQTTMYEVFPVETATFTPAVISMADKRGVALPIEPIRSEPSIVLLYDYWARYVAYWNMNAYEQFSLINDQSRNNLDGTATGTSRLDGHDGGDARSFDGSGDYVEVPDNAALDLDDEITISMWIYLGGYGLNPLSSLICKRTKDGPINYQLLLADPSSTDGQMSFLFRYGGSTYHTYRVDIPDSWRNVGWFHVLFSYRFGEPASAMFVLGQGCFIDEMPGEWIAGNGREPAPNTSGALFMGKDNASTTGYFEGGLDEVELFDIVWTPGLIQHYLFTGCR